jgi:hypothetical protein
MCRVGPHGEGDEPKPMMNEREKSDPAVVAVKSANGGRIVICVPTAICISPRELRLFRH